MAVNTDRDFERLVLPLLRLFWPNLVRPPKLKRYDSSGIDLVAQDSSGDVLCVVQCKGFYSDRELVQDHLTQIRKSVGSFKKSALSCEEFVLLHNRTAANRKITKQIEDELDTLVTAGKAARVRLWDRQSFVRDARARLEELITTRLGEEYQRLLQQIEHLFAFGAIYVPAVPVTTHNLHLKKWMPPTVEIVHNGKEELSELVLSSGGRRWTLLTGAFGTGKSTAALHAAIGATGLVIYTRCAELSFDSDVVGTNLLMRGVLQALHLFDDFDDEDRARLEQLAGTTLRTALSRPETDAILVLDGLDENRVFSTAAGMTALANALAELRCPVLMTTRHEHFNATFGNFDLSLEELGDKGGAVHKARLFRLGAWTDAEVVQFLDQAMQCSDGDKRERLARLVTAIKAREPLPWPTELLRHPLFLQMITELAADGQTGTRSRAETIEEWAMRKIGRDLTVPRLTPVEVIERSAFVDRTMQLMERAAAKMMSPGEDGYELGETVASEWLSAEAGQLFGVANIDIAAISGTSLLIPVTERRTANVAVKFSHRAFQEFFTARHACIAGLEPGTVPEPVRRLMIEMPGSVPS